jgi:cytochrome bd-type quinol oxidase subunit 2
MSQQPLFPRPGIPRPNLDVLLRTRRTVMEAANEMHAQKARSRRKMGVVLLCLGVLLLVMTPTIWISVDDLMGGEHLFDMPAMILALAAVFITTILATLMVGWKRQQEVRHDR